MVQDSDIEFIPMLDVAIDKFDYWVKNYDADNLLLLKIFVGAIEYDKKLANTFFVKLKKLSMDKWKNALSKLVAEMQRRGIDF